MKEKLIIRIYLDNLTLYFGEQDMFFPVSAPFPYKGGIVSPGTLIKKLANLYTGSDSPNSYTFSIDDVEQQIYISLKDREYRSRAVIVERIDLDTDSVIETYNFIINDINFTRTSAVFTCEDRPLTAATDIYPKNTISLDDFPNVPDGTDSIGQYINICFGKCKNIRLYLIEADLENNYWYYLIGYGSPPLSAATTVRRAGQDVVPSEYTFFDGSQFAKYPGFAFIRFNREQIDLRGGLYIITMDLDGFELDAAFTENPARQYQEFITNTIWGQGGVADAAYFTQAITDTDALGLKGGGVISGGKTGEYWKKEFLKACREGISTTGPDGIRLVIPSYDPVSIASFTPQNSSIKAFKKAKASDYVKDIAVYYWYDNNEKRYLNDNKKNIDVSFGVTKDFNLQLVSDAKTASVFAQYKQKQMVERDKKFIILPFKDAETLVENNIIDINYPLLGLNSELYIVEKITKNGLDYSMTVAEYSDIYTWDSETFQADPPAPPSNSAPDELEGIGITKSSIVQKDGTVQSWLNVDYTLPDNNFLYATVALKRSGDSTWQDIGQTDSGKYKVTNIEQVSEYDVRLTPVNSAGLKPGLPTTVPNVLSSGQASAPAVPLNFSAYSSPLSVILNWDDNTEADFNHYNVYRDGIKIFETKSSKYSDAVPEYDVDYSYRISAVNNSKKESTKTAGIPARKLSVSGDDIDMGSSSLNLAPGADIIFTGCAKLDATTDIMYFNPEGLNKDLNFGTVADPWKDILSVSENVGISCNDAYSAAAVNDMSFISSAGDINLTAFGLLKLVHATLAFFGGAGAAKQSTPDPAVRVTTETAGASYTSNEQDMLNNLSTDNGNIWTALKAVTDAMQAYDLTSS